jgi:hypothetical protein
MSNLAQKTQLSIPDVIGSPILAKIEHINDLGKSKWRLFITTMVGIHTQEVKPFRMENKSLIGSTARIAYNGSRLCVRWGIKARKFQPTTKLK